MNLSDSEILALDDGAPPPELQTVSPASPSESIPAETPTAEATPNTAAPTQVVEPSDDYKWAAPLLRNPEIATRFKAAQERLTEFNKFFGSVAGAREFKTLIGGVGGIEGIKALRAKSETLDKVDEQLYSGDPAQRRTVLQSVYEQSPAHFMSAIKAGIDLVGTRNPDFISAFVGERLETDLVWDFLEHIYEVAQRSGLQEVAQRLNSFAGIFAKYGLGPQINETGEAAERRHDFNQVISENFEQRLGPIIGFHLKDISGDAHQEIALRVHAEIQSAMQRDSTFRFHVQNVMRTGGFSVKTARKLDELMHRKAAAILPGALRRALGAYGASTKQATAAVSDKAKNKAAPTNGAERPLTQRDANGMSYRAILDSTRKIEKTSSPRPAKLTKGEAQGMTFKQVIEDDREVGEWTNA